VTETVDRGSSSPPLADVIPDTRASWPYIDRRGTVKTVDIHPLRRAADLRATTAEVSASPAPARLRRPVRWDSLYAVSLAAVDGVAAVSAGIVAAGLATRAPADPALHPVAFFLMPIVWTVCVYFQRGYERPLLGAGAEEFQRVAAAAVTFFAAFAAFQLATRANVARSYVLIAVPFAASLSLVGRYLARQALHLARRRGRCLTDVLLVGPSTAVAGLARQLRREQLSGLRVIGACVPGGAPGHRLAEADLPVLGDMFQAAHVVRETGVGAVAVTACAEMHGAALRQLAWDLESTGADLVVAPALVEIAGPRLHLRPAAGLSLLHVEEPEFRGGRRLLKGAMDRVLALAGCIVLAPAFLAIAIAIRMTTPGHAMYQQLRVGRDGKLFVVYKFRSMYVDADSRLTELERQNECADGLLFKVHDDPRITRVGQWLRKYSLDELPQLFNVLRGDMSLVGPRPPLPTEVARYGSAVQRRLLVKPGVTGLWQVSGRSDLSWDESVRLDLRYVENWSLMLDVSILWKTMFAVVRGSGAY